MKVAASPRSMTRLQLFWHSLSHIRRFSPLRMTKQGDARTQHLVTSRWGLLIPSYSSLLSNLAVQVPIPFPWKGKGLARAKHDDFEALLIFMCCTKTT